MVEYHTNQNHGSHITVTATAALAIVFLLTGCGTVVKENVVNKSYSLGQKITTPSNELMIFREQGSVEKKKRWVGILNSPDGYEVYDTRYSPGFSRQELIYRGESGATITIEYRELHAGSIVPQFQESRQFDLSVTHDIVVRNFQLNVIQANEASISFSVTAD